MVQFFCDNMNYDTIKSTLMDLLIYIIYKLMPLRKNYIIVTIKI